MAGTWSCRAKYLGHILTLQAMRDLPAFYSLIFLFGERVSQKHVVNAVLGQSLTASSFTVALHNNKYLS